MNNKLSKPYINWNISNKERLNINCKIKICKNTKIENIKNCIKD